MIVGKNTSGLAQELANTLVQLNRIVWQQHDSVNGLRSSEFIFMAYLAAFSDAATGGIKASDLGKAMKVTGAAVTHNLNAMDKAGFVERVADPSDRRIVLIILTDAGQKILEQVNEIFLENLNGLINYLGEKDSAELIRLLLLMTSYLMTADF